MLSPYFPPPKHLSITISETYGCGGSTSDVDIHLGPVIVSVSITAPLSLLFSYYYIPFDYCSSTSMVWEDTLYSSPLLYYFLSFYVFLYLFFSYSSVQFGSFVSTSMVWGNTCYSSPPLNYFPSSNGPLLLIFFSSSIPFNSSASTSMIWGDTCYLINRRWCYNY